MDKKFSTHSTMDTKKKNERTYTHTDIYTQPHTSRVPFAAVSGGR